jgi:hypothetical protein
MRSLVSAVNSFMSNCFVSDWLAANNLKGGCKGELPRSLRHDLS